MTKIRLVTARLENAELAADDLTDEELVARVVCADEAAFRALAVRHGGRYRALAYRFLLDTALAEDLVQEAFVKLWTRADLFQAHKAKFTTWFHRIVVNRCLDEKRKRKPQSMPEGYDAEDRALKADKALEISATQKRLQAVLGSLTEQQKTAVILKYFDDLSNQEAADVMALNIKAYESLLVRARTTMRKRMNPERADLLSAFAG